MAFSFFDVQPTDDGVIYSTQSAGGRSSKKTMSGVIARHAGPGAPSEIIGEASERIQGIDLGRDGTVYAVTAKGRLLCNASGDFKAKNLKLPDLQRVRVLEGERLALAGDGGTVALGSLDAGFEAQQFAAGQNPAYMYGLSASTAGTVVAVGAAGVVMEAGDGWFVAREAEARTLLFGVHVVADDDVIVVGEPGILRRGDPKRALRSLAVPTGMKHLKAVCAFQGAIYLAAGGDGVFRLDGDTLVCVEPRIAAYTLASSASLLCAAGLGSWACFDGTTWTANNEDRPIG